MMLATPHGDKLKALLCNPKLPEEDKPRLQECLERYHRWLQSTQALPEGVDSIEAAVQLLNEYRLYLDLEVIFDSSKEFLYRQRGQLKLESSVVEEFLPHLVLKVFPELQGKVYIGPQVCYSSLVFQSHCLDNRPQAAIRTKAQDFAVARLAQMRIAFYDAQELDWETHTVGVGYVCAECKTNLDKTMFREAMATAQDLKRAVPTARYFLMCEWLDMVPVSTSGTEIDEVLILRKARRLDAGLRGEFSRAEQRRKRRSEYAEFLKAYPFSAEVFHRFLSHVRTAILPAQLDIETVLRRGYF